jgi:tRNA(Ile)-lysidine synthase
MCLLHWLGNQKDLHLCAAHFEHGLRGEESRRDAAFVAEYCAAHKIPCAVEHGDVAAFAREKGLGIEEAARELRYAFLERTAADWDCDRIATAHNADDNAETLLLNLVRGAGTAGLSGIPPRRGKIVRPLLGFTRREIEAYLNEHEIPHVEDSSNASDA